MLYNKHTIIAHIHDSDCFIETIHQTYIYCRFEHRFAIFDPTICNTEIKIKHVPTIFYKACVYLLRVKFCQHIKWVNLDLGTYIIWKMETDNV